MSVDLGRHPELREVRGPGALGGGPRRFFDLLWMTAVTEFKRVYFGTVLGYLWSLIRPLMLFGVLLIVFTKVFHVGSNQVQHYPVYLLMGIVLFTFFQEATTNSVASVVTAEGIVRKTQFPRLVIPLALVLTGLMNLGLNMIAVFAFILAFGVDPTWTWLLLPVIVLALTVLTTAVSMLLSALYVRFRDLEIIWSVIATMLFYGTPILYPIDLVPEEFRELMLCNPLLPIFQQAREWIIDPAAQGAVEAAGGWLQILPSIALYVGICVLAWRVFAREAPRIAESL